MKQITKKILIINKLLFPKEIIDIIKSYAFYNIFEETKKRKNKIISLFSGDIYYSNDGNPDEYPDCPYPIIGICDTIFYKEKDIEWYFCLSYCTACGKYIRRERLITYIKKNLHCEC